MHPMPPGVRKEKESHQLSKVIIDLEKMHKAFIWKFWSLKKPKNKDNGWKSSRNNNLISEVVVLVLKEDNNRQINDIV